MSEPYLAPSLVVLRKETNLSYPNRDDESDGWIGDKRHQHLKSDHNPDPLPNGVVRATDTDKDGIDAMRLVRTAIADPRTEYVIFNGFIWSRAFGFKKRVYLGKNKHYGHVHISIRHGRLYENDPSPWGFYTPPADPTLSGDIMLDEATEKQLRKIIQDEVREEVRTLLGNPNSDLDADKTHDSLADIRRDLRNIVEFLEIKTR